MRYPGRVTMCVSSQAGCGMACPFCATGQGGLQRNMSTAEIVEQVVAGARSLARDEVPGGPGRVSNVVFMGMGEPMANYKAVIGAVRRLTDPTPDGLGMSARGITVSARSGLVPRINQLAEEGIPVTLALSLHAPDDELRNELVPVNTRWQVDETVDAAWNYARVTKRRVSIEYAMMRGINDQAWRADLLADVLNARGDWGWVHVNLIPLNPTPGLEVDRAVDPGRRARVRPPAGGQGHPHDRPRHPRQRDRRRLRPARRGGLSPAQARAVTSQAAPVNCTRPSTRWRRSSARTSSSRVGPALGSEGDPELLGRAAAAAVAQHHHHPLLDAVAAVEPVVAGRVQRLDRDLAPAGRVEDRAHPVGVGEGHRAGGTGLGRRGRVGRAGRRAARCRG